MSERLLNAKDYTIDAGGKAQISIPGTYFQLMESSSDVTIRFFRHDSEIGIAENVPEGFTFGPVAEPWHRVEIESAAAQTVKASVSRAATGLLRITGAIDADITKATTLDSLPDVVIGAGATQILAAADSTRREILVSNLAANASPIRVGDGGASAANGVPCAPGETVTITTSGAVYAYSATAQSVAVTVTKD